MILTKWRLVVAYYCHSRNIKRIKGQRWDNHHTVRSMVSFSGLQPAVDTVTVHSTNGILNNVTDITIFQFWLFQSKQLPQYGGKEEYKHGCSTKGHRISSQLPRAAFTTSPVPHFSACKSSRHMGSHLCSWKILRCHWNYFLFPLKSHKFSFSWYCNQGFLPDIWTLQKSQTTERKNTDFRVKLDGIR